MAQLNKQQAEEIIGLIQETQMNTVFDKFEEYQVKHESLSLFRRQFILGKYGDDFYERLQVFVNELAHTHIRVSPPKRYDIFFSYSSKDKAEAIKHVQVLRKCGMQVFFSDDELKDGAGQDFIDKINYALEHSDHFILHCTESAMQSPWVRKEYKTFYYGVHLKDEKRVFFILKGKGFKVELIPFEFKFIEATNLPAILKVLQLELPEEEQIKKLKEENEALKEKNEQNKDKITQFKTQIAQLEVEIETTEKQKIKLDVQLKQLQKDFEKASVQLKDTAQTDQLKASFEATLKEKEQVISKLKEKITALEKALKEEQAQKSIYEKAIAEEQEKNRQNIASLQKVQQALEEEEAKTKTLQANLQTLQEKLKNIEAGTKSQTTSASPSGKSYTETINGVSFEMIWVEGGKFDFQGTKPINLDGFYMAKYLVTQELYEAVTGENPSYFKGNPQNPVESVSWEDIVNKFLPKFEKLTGKKYKLPSEAQWEYAAKGGQKSQGYEYAGSNDIDEVAWYDKNSGNSTQPVGQKKPNELGIYDMSGNVWEWCADDWHNNYEKILINGSAFINNPRANARVLRGGGWFILAEFCRSTIRYDYAPFYYGNEIGFRFLL